MSHSILFMKFETDVEISDFSDTIHLCREREEETRIEPTNRIANFHASCEMRTEDICLQ